MTSLGRRHAWPRARGRARVPAHARGRAVALTGGPGETAAAPRDLVPVHMMRGAATCAVSRLVVLLGGLVVVHGQEAPCVVLLANCAAADGDPCLAAAGGDGMDCSALVERAMSGKRCTPEQRHELLMLVSMGIHNQRCHIDVSDIVSQQHRRALLRGGGPGDTVASMRWTQRRGLQDTGGVLCQTAEQFLALVATVNIACCGSQEGCGDGFPTTCTMTCSAEYLPFIERCHDAKEQTNYMARLWQQQLRARAALPVSQPSQPEATG